MTQPIQMQLSKKVYIFFQCFAQFLESPSNFKHLGKEDDPRSVCILEVTDSERYDWTTV